jgi:hypothetical protein
VFYFINIKLISILNYKRFKTIKILYKMSEQVKNTYDKMQEYIEAVFNIFKNINKKSVQQKDQKLKYISLAIYNYVIFMTQKYDVTLNNLSEPETINMIPIFEYISYNNIELYDFLKIEVSDIDTKKNEDLERFILTHIYYITQPNSI